MSELTKRLEKLADADARLRHIVNENYPEIAQALRLMGKDLGEIADELLRQLRVCRERAELVHQAIREQVTADALEKGNKMHEVVRETIKKG